MVAMISRLPRRTAGTQLGSCRVTMERTQLNDFYDQPLAPKTRQEVLSLCGLDGQRDYSQTRLLDFGAGGGRYLECFATVLDAANLAGVEVDPDQIARTRARGFHCVQLDPQRSELPFADQAFDVVFSSNVVEHIPRELYLSYLKEIQRVLRPRGRFVVGTPNYPFKRLYDFSKAFKSGRYRYYFFDDPTHCNKLSLTRLEADLRSHFRSIEIEPTYLFLERKIPVLRWPAVRRKLRHFGDKLVGVCIK
jgi:SAM-dependent methyltransferase